MVWSIQRAMQERDGIGRLFLIILETSQEMYLKSIIAMDEGGGCSV